MTYAGLTISDKPALLDAKSKGYDNAYLNFNGYPERVMVDLALAQIAEMDSKQNNALSEKASEKGCMTWNERINQMTVEEKAKFLTTNVQIDCEMFCKLSIDCCCNGQCEEYMKEWLNSPYTEGEKK